ncbi:MAG: metalloregulator ArsR/SmtB family transcription factor [Anaerohalosphaeraceae bacterium]
MEKEAAYLKGLSDPIRLRLAVMLAVRGELCVCLLAEALRQPQYKISRHLSILRRQGIVEVRRQGTWMYYRLRPPAGPMERSLQNCLADCFRSHPTVRQDLQRLDRAQCSPNPSKNERKQRS